MADPRTDPFDALHSPVIPLAPDPGFAANSVNRLRALLAPTTEEPSMST